jgi:deazaflavin-dependent oxidoreductase (nitroreductase family)
VLHPALYRLTRGRWVLGRVLGCEMLLLTTRGRRTGTERTTALFGFPDADRWVVVASRGGSGRIPAWYLNLAAEPRVRVQHRARRWLATASVAEGEERVRLWSVATGAYPGFEVYQEAAVHEIPVVVLAPGEPL